MAAIIKKIRQRKLKAEVVLVFSDNPQAGGLQIAIDAGYKTLSFSPSSFSSKTEYEKKLVEALKKYQAEWVVCAGYMRILKKDMLNAFYHRILNIHPSLLPAFPGLKPQKQALDYGVQYTGCTVHFVDEGMDTGPIISQKAIKIYPNDHEAVLTKRILKEEHDLYWRALKKVFD